MPKAFSEVSQTSSKSDGDASSLAFSRVFRIVLSEPGEEISVESVCGVRVGDPHPVITDAICTAYDAAFEGSSRLVILVTFNYQARPTDVGGGGNPGPPDSRPATWSLSSAIYERPVRTWRERFNDRAWGASVPAINYAGDFYDGVTTLDAMVTISIRQFTLNDITTHCQYVGSVNDEEIRLGSLVMAPHTVMLRGVQAEAVAIPYGDQIYRGFNATYEFAYRENKTLINMVIGFGGGMGVNQGAGGQREVPLGWDIAVPQTGFNVKAFTPGAGRPDRDPFGQPLKHGNGKIGFEDGLPLLPQGITDGDKVRAMVLVYEYEDGGASQTPSAMPVPLNTDGTARKIDVGIDRLPIVNGYQVHNSINITNTLGLRLQ